MCWRAHKEDAADRVASFHPSAQLHEKEKNKTKLVFIWPQALLWHSLFVCYCITAQEGSPEIYLTWVSEDIRLVMFWSRVSAPLLLMRLKRELGSVVDLGSRESSGFGQIRTHRRIKAALLRGCNLTPCISCCSSSVQMDGFVLLKKRKKNCLPTLTCIYFLSLLIFEVKFRDLQACWLNYGFWTFVSCRFVAHTAWWWQQFLLWLSIRMH